MHIRTLESDVIRCFHIRIASKKASKTANKMRIELRAMFPGGKAAGETDTKNRRTTSPQVRANLMGQRTRCSIVFYCVYLNRHLYL